MGRILPLTLAALAATCPVLHAQQVDDPANLRGERVALPDPADNLPINHGAPALEQLLRKLRTRASLMMIVAHPDDEDGGLLTYESRGVGARVAMLTLTRGEGGQNLMSADFDDALGLLRTQELLAADRYMGVDQMFGTEVDFGFSKTREETLKKWTHDRVLYDAVRAVRLYRPLVLASVFVGGVTDGHGHHQVAGEITQEVFLAAADPNIFPEMMQQGLTPWAPLKVYARVPFSRVEGGQMYDYATGRSSPARFHNYITGVDITHEPSATVVVHEGAKSDVAAMQGDTWVQWARRGLALEKSQIGPGVRVPPAGVYDVGYTLMACRIGKCNPSTVKEESLFDGIDTRITALADDGPTVETLSKIDGLLERAQNLLTQGKVRETAGPLDDALKLLDTIVSENKSRPRSAGLLHELRVKRAQLLEAHDLAHGNATPAADALKPVPRPYFSRPDIEQPFYDVAAPALRNAPSTPANLRVATSLSVPPAGGRTTFDAPEPDVSVSVSPTIGIIRPGVPVTLNVTLRANVALTLSMLHLEMPTSWTSLPVEVKWRTAEAGESKQFAFQIMPPKQFAGKPVVITAVAEAGRKYRESVRLVGYPGLRPTTMYTPATFKAVAVDVVTAPNLRVAYVSGTGDNVATLMPNLGITPTLLFASDLTPARLRSFDVVLLGVRAYNAHPELAGAPSKALLDFAREGGVVIAQYNTGSLPAGTSPYPINIPGDPAHNVVEEEQPVQILTSSAPVLNWPNKITPADFNGWVAERGHGFASSFAPQFQAPLEMHDVDQDPQSGGLLIAPLGMGAWVYCALALYRQLPEGVPGAYRLLANLLSLGRNPAFLEQSRHLIQAEKGLSE